MKVFYFLAAIVLPLVAQEDETPALKELVTGNLQFTANTYQELAKTNVDKNFLVCPLSVAVVLALAEAGAGGKTADQLITGLNLPNSEEKIHEAFKSIAPSLNVNDQYTLSSANKIYIKNGYKIKPHFKDVATQVFNAEVSEIEFTKNVEAAEEINKWVLDKTHDKIKDLISSSDLDQDTRLVLINALYFHGLWLEPFYVDGTLDKKFHISSTKNTVVKMMEQTAHFNFYRDTTLKAKFLEMRYAQSPISMIFVLPDEIDGLSALEANIIKVLETPKFSRQKVHVQIPRVHIEDKIDFIPVLQKLGVVDAFDGVAANFSRINENEEQLVISKIIQKTFIDIEEKGTTAAAATALVFVGYSAFIEPPETPEEFNANHPFIFILKSPNGILFAGRYVLPA